MWRFQKFTALPLLLATVTAAIAGCESTDFEDLSKNPGESACPPSAAEILVEDGLMQIACGCAEPAGTTSNPPASLTCTVPIGTTVFFQFTGTILPHQLVPATGSQFVPTAIFDPTQDGAIRAAADVFATAGSYAFQDAFDVALNGTIVVQ